MAAAAPIPFWEAVWQGSRALLRAHVGGFGNVGSNVCVQGCLPRLALLPEFLADSLTWLSDPSG